MKSWDGRLYPSDLSDLQWELIEKRIPQARRGGRKRSTDARAVVNAVFYVIRSGCSWRYLPKGFPAWQTVYGYFRDWKLSGIWKEIHDELVKIIRVRDGRNESPSAVIIDTQSAKAQYGEKRGYDAYKQIRGRKRHVLVDTLGLLKGAKVHCAKDPDPVLGYELLEKSYSSTISRKEKEMRSQIEQVYADGAYRGYFAHCVKQEWPYAQPIITRKEGEGSSRLSAKAKRATTNLKPKRWIVERTFAWLNHYRRLARDYERKTAHSEATIYLAMTQLMLGRLARC